MGSDEKGPSLWIEVKSASVAVGLQTPERPPAVHECAPSALGPASMRASNFHRSFLPLEDRRATLNA
jgi:hypothetical protein